MPNTAALVISTPSWAAAAPGLPGGSSHSGNHEHMTMAKAASPCPGASPHVCSLTALCRDSASSLPRGLGASSHREQLLLQNKCPTAWEPHGAQKAWGERASPGVAPQFPSGCSCLGGQHPFCLVIPGWCSPFMDSAAGRAMLQAQFQIPGAPGCASAGKQLNPNCSGSKVRSSRSHCRGWGQ